MDLGPDSYLLIATVAFAAQVLGGISGYGTGLILPLVLVPLIGAQAVVPVIALSAMITNPVRVWTFWKNLDGRAALTVVLLAFPGAALGAVGFSLLSGFWAQVLIGGTLMALAPTGRILRRRRLRLPDAGFRASLAAYGFIMGGTSGAGVILVSILMARGLAGAAVVATDAAATTVLATLKVGVFASAGALPQNLWALSILIGLMAIPGARVGKLLMHRFGLAVQTAILDLAVFTGGLVMVWRAFL